MAFLSTCKFRWRILSTVNLCKIRYTVQCAGHSSCTVQRWPCSRNNSFSLTWSSHECLFPSFFLFVAMLLWACAQCIHGHRWYKTYPTNKIVEIVQSLLMLCRVFRMLCILCVRFHPLVGNRIHNFRLMYVPLSLLGPSNVRTVWKFIFSA